MELGNVGPRGRPPLRIPRSHRVVGRFQSGRRMVACALAAYQRVETIFANRRAFAGKSLFEGMPTKACLTALRLDGFFPGLALSAYHVASLEKHARETPCIVYGPRPERFLITDVRNGRTPKGRVAPVADVDLSEPNPVIEDIARDGFLAEVAEQQLGYRPRRVRKRLFWSPVSTLSDDERRWNGQTIDFHYDIDACNSLYVYFYLTDTDRESGAHTLLAGSHRPKPLRIIFSSCFQPEERVMRRYGADNQIVLEGGPGFGFIEDPACFHKALVPRRADRLVLQLRYS
jgi:hypothetical protein